MTAITFDTLKLTQRLRDKAKYSPEQAEHTAEAIAETFVEWQEQLVTKENLQTFKSEMKSDFRVLEAEMKNTESRLETKIAESKSDLIKWVVGMGFAQMITAIILGVLKLH